MDLTPEQIKDEASHHGFIGNADQLIKFARAIEAKARRDALTEAERICDHYATALDGGANEYTRSRECMQAANAIRALKEGKP